MENNYMYFKCRSVADYKGGAAGDKVDRDHRNPGRVKNYQNYEKLVANNMKRGYRKIHQDA